MTRFFCGASARAARAVGVITWASVSDSGWAESPVGEVISGTGIGAVPGVGVACHGLGRPTRSLTVMAGPRSSNVASATNSSATSAKPTDARKARVCATQNSLDIKARSQAGLQVSIRGEVVDRIGRPCRGRHVLAVISADEWR